ncbi:MAG: Zn-dependent exopeptidase M28, partial [Thermoplasmatales archaeon]|nr:Zn-dependent exopeptidase M28 [Thermoplasmatales archaeon]
WDEKGTYDIRVKAKDTKGNESDWSDPLVVSMPMNNAISNPILLWIYNIIINRFPIFGSILQMLL